MKKGIPLLLFLVVTGLLTVETVQAQGTAFTYQGHLDKRWGGTANGSYDLTFTIYDSMDSGEVIAGPLTRSAVAITNGLFTTTVDFGDGVFNGDPRWLEIGVRTNGSPAFGSPPFTILSPRQAMLPAPYAMAAGNLVGPATNQVNSAVQAATNGFVGTVNSAIQSATNNLLGTVTNIARSFGGSATNAINNNNGVGTNVTVYGTLTSTNLDARIQSATNNLLGTVTNIAQSFAGSATNAINNNNGMGTNVTVYGTLTSTNLDARIQSATNNLLVVATNAFDALGAAHNATNNYPWGSLYQPALTYQPATNGGPVNASQISPGNLPLTVTNTGPIAASQVTAPPWATNSAAGIVSAEGFQPATNAAPIVPSQITSGNLSSTVTNTGPIAATNLAGLLPQYPRVQIATNIPFTNAVLISPDGTNRVWSAATNLFDITGAGTLAAHDATNNYPWGSLYQPPLTYQPATNGGPITASQISPGNLPLTVTNTGPIAVSQITSPPWATNSAAGIVSAEGFQPATNAAPIAPSQITSGNLSSTVTNTAPMDAANLIGMLPQYPTVQIATNIPFTNAVLISPDGTNRVWSAGTNLFDAAGLAATAAGSALVTATNAFALNSGGVVTNLTIYDTSAGIASTVFGANGIVRTNTGTGNNFSQMSTGLTFGNSNNTVQSQFGNSSTGAVVSVIANGATNAWNFNTNGAMYGNAGGLTNYGVLSPNVIYVDTNSLGDAYGVIGDKMHPFKNFNYAWSNCPAGGTIWLSPNQYFTFPSAGVTFYPVRVPMSIVGNGSTLYLTPSQTMILLGTNNFSATDVNFTTGPTGTVGPFRFVNTGIGSYSQNLFTRCTFMGAIDVFYDGLLTNGFSVRFVDCNITNGFDWFSEIIGTGYDPASTNNPTVSYERCQWFFYRDPVVSIAANAGKYDGGYYVSYKDCFVDPTGVSDNQWRPIQFSFQGRASMVADIVNCRFKMPNTTTNFAVSVSTNATVNIYGNPCAYTNVFVYPGGQLNWNPLSEFVGAFIGNGSGLTNLPATAITNLGTAALQPSSAFDLAGAGTTAAYNATNGYPWSSLYDPANAALNATNAGNILFTNQLPGLTNGFVTSSITNGLATTNYVNAITNGLATTAYVTGQGYVMSSITNGLATTAYVVAATNAGNIVFTNNTTWFDSKGAASAAVATYTPTNDTTWFDSKGAAASVLTTATNAANLIGNLPQYPTVQIATNAPFTNAVLISPDGTNRAWSIFDNTNGGIGSMVGNTFFQNTNGSWAYTNYTTPASSSWSFYRPWISFVSTNTSGNGSATLTLSVAYTAYNNLLKTNTIVTSTSLITPAELGTTVLSIRCKGDTPIFFLAVTTNTNPYDIAFGLQRLE